MTNINFLLTISIQCQEISLWEVIKWSPKRKCLDLLSNSLNAFFKEMYRDQFGEFVCGYQCFSNQVYITCLKFTVVGHITFIWISCWVCPHEFIVLIVLEDCKVQTLTNWQNKIQAMEEHSQDIWTSSYYGMCLI